MKKVKIKMMEARKCDREIIVTVPNDYEIERLLNAAYEKKFKYTEDVIRYLRVHGCEDIKELKGYFNDSEVEIVDYGVEIYDNERIPTES